MKKVLFVFAFLIAFSQAFSIIVINEFQAENVSTVQDPEFHAYSDWIELFNSGTTSVDVSGYYLTDNISDTTKWKIPTGTSIPANGYIVIWADNNSIGTHTIGLHTNFKLDNKGTELALYSSNKILLDSYISGVVKDDISIGRKVSNQQVWAEYYQPTPGTANSTSRSLTAAQEPTMSIKSGFYPTAQTVAITSPIAGTTIRYTTNGTTPTSYSSIYTSPLHITRNTVLKAIVFQSYYKNSRVVAQTYFIGERNISLPVVSIGVDSLDMFDETNGLYSLGPNASSEIPNYGANFWEDTELPATFEYFVNGKRQVQVNAGIAIHGAWSRRFAQRSFAINCSNQFGDERMQYKFFKSKNISSFKKIILKNAGCDVNSLKYRDAMINSLASANMDIDYQAYQPSIAFVNGHYWGILNIREKTTEDYVKNNYGLDSSNVDMIYNFYGHVISGESTDFDDLYSYIDENQTNNSTVYKNISSMMDIDEYIDYYIAEIYVANRDWPGYNIKYWKQKGTGNLWRWILYDTDQSFSYYEDANEYVNSLVDATTEDGTSWPNPQVSTMMLRKLLENTTFKDLFVQRFAAHMNSTFSPDSVKHMVDKIEGLLAGEKSYHLARWGKTDSLWNVEYDNLIKFSQNRPALMQGYIKNYFGILGMNVLTLKATNNNSPRFKLSNVNLKGQNIVGKYFKNIPFTLEALNESGLTFVEWQNASGTTISKNSVISVTLNSDATYVAVYEETPGIKNVFINEFMAANKSKYKDEAGEFEDWIEIYNANDYPVDLAESYITDDLTNPYKFKFVKGLNNETVIPAKGYLIVWADEEMFQGVLHSNFKLSASGESIGLCQNSNNEVYWIDSLSYKMQSDDKSFGRITDGGLATSILSNVTPGAANSSISNSIHPDYLADYGISIYPTIANKEVFVENKTIEDATLSIYSIDGKLVLYSKIINNETKSIPVTNLAHGMYIVQIKSETKNFEGKIIVR